MISALKRKNDKMNYQFKNAIINKCFFNLLILFLITNTTNCYASGALDVTPLKESTPIRVPKSTFTFTGYDSPGGQSFSLHIENADIDPSFLNGFMSEIGESTVRSLTMDNCRFHSAGIDEASSFLFLKKLHLNYLTIRNSNLSDSHFYELLGYLEDDLNYLDLSNNKLGENIQQFQAAINKLILSDTFHVSTLKLPGNPINVEDKLMQSLFLKIREGVSVFKIQDGEPLTGPELDTLVSLLERVGGSPNKTKEIKTIRRKIARRGITDRPFNRTLRALNFDGED